MLILYTNYITYVPAIAPQTEEERELTNETNLFLNFLNVANTRILSKMKCNISKSPDAPMVQEIYKICVWCYTKDTPMWRTGPHHAKELCNACGLKYRNYHPKKPKNSNESN